MSRPEGEEPRLLSELGVDDDKTATLEPPVKTGEVRRFTLRVSDGPDAPMAMRSRAERTVIGSHESADLRLTDPAVSRFHCEIDLSSDRAVLRDLGSRNGTLIDGVEIREAFLKDGSEVHLGRTKLAFDLKEERLSLSVSTQERFGQLVGRSISMRQVFATLERAAASLATVLLEGETGTGKEAAAESIHQESSRRERPFVVIDCGAIPSNLLESELFGHEKGSFTGANGPREGVLEVANGGTVFLDEIGELSLDLQPKLLRALERRQIKRVGSNTYTPIDVRVIAATHRDLRVEVNARRFRSDLFYRLAVLQIRLPALRERTDDLPLLVEHLAESLGLSSGTGAGILKDPAMLAEMGRYSWPGNVRELRNYIERCVALGAQAPLDVTESPAEPSIDPAVPIRVARERWVSSFERRYLAELLVRHENNVTAAARGAGIDRIHLYRLLWRHGLR